MALLNTEIIDNLNKQIEGVVLYADNMTNLINEEINNNTHQAQEIINTKFDELSSQMSEKGNDVRNKTINIFKAQYQSALEKIKPIEPLLNISVTPDTVVNVVKSIITVLTAPYQPIIQFTTEVIPKVLQLSNNLQKLAAYQPDINVPDGVKVPPLTVNIEPITPQDITGGSGS